MSEICNHPATRPSVDEGIKVLLRYARRGISLRFQKCEIRIRESPTTAVIGAVAIGYVLHRMPVRSILVTQMRVLSALAPPTAFFYGAAKLYEFLHGQELNKRK
jgi:hypothetical protein